MKPYVPRAPYVDRLRARVDLLDRGARRVASICADLGHVEAVYAFGSFATRTIRMHSDLDVLVVHDPGVSRRECENEIRRRFDLAIGLDLILVTPEEYRTGLPATSFGRTILATAIRIDAT